MRWVECDHACDPQATGARTDGAWHYSDCPVWDYLGVSPSDLRNPPVSQSPGGAV